MKVHVMTGAAPLRQFRRFATRAAEAGFDGLVVTEAGRTAFLSCAAAALADADLDLATGVAVAFPRSPTVTAAIAWELADASGGRFRLGLGTQVRAHIERRYSSPFDPPGPRLREYVLALRAVFAAFRGAPLSFEGRFYNLSLMPPMWSAGAIEAPDPPIDIAAVNPWMLRMAAEVADGVHIHPLNTPTYLRDTAVPDLGAGSPGKRMSLFIPTFTVLGDTEEERAPWRDVCRTQIAFYGTTPNYAFIFEQLGFPDITPRLREAQKRGDLAGMAAVISDDLLPHFTVECDWDDAAAALHARLAPLEEHHDVNVVMYVAGMAARAGGNTFERFGEVARELRGRDPG
jgi:probable F420-dependent oxidoreductase